MANIGFAIDTIKSESAPSKATRNYWLGTQHIYLVDNPVSGQKEIFQKFTDGSFGKNKLTDADLLATDWKVYNG